MCVYSSGHIYSWFTHFVQNFTANDLGILISFQDHWILLVEAHILAIRYLYAVRKTFFLCPHSGPTETHFLLENVSFRSRLWMWTFSKTSAGTLSTCGEIISMKTVHLGHYYIGHIHTCIRTYLTICGSLLSYLLLLLELHRGTWHNYISIYNVLGLWQKFNIYLLSKLVKVSMN